MKTINLTDYTKEEILSAVESYGYEISFFSSIEVFNLEQNNYQFSVETSIQLACECIFELEM